MAKMVTLINENGEPVAPRTAASAVSTASGRSVETVLDEKLNKGDIPSTIDLLWTNPNSTTGFAAQTIPLDLSRYRLIKIVYGYTNSNTSYIGSVGGSSDIPKECFGRSAILSAYDGYWRQFTVNVDGVVCTTGHKGGTETTQACVPIAIYGIK